MTSPVLLPAGHTVVHADMAAYENLTGLWTTYTPAWTASVNPVLGNGSISAAYIQVGKLLICAGTITMGSTTTFGTSAWSIAYPVSINNNLWTNGVVTCYDADSSTSHRPGATRSNSATTFSATATTGWVQSTDPFVWAVNDELHWFICTQAA